MGTQENEAKLAEILREWQHIENQTVVQTAQIVDRTRHPVIRFIMQIIQSDSATHFRVQQLILDSLEKEAITLTVDDLTGIWDAIEAHVEAERRTASSSSRRSGRSRGRRTSCSSTSSLTSGTTRRSTNGSSRISRSSSEACSRVPEVEPPRRALPSCAHVSRRDSIVGGNGGQAPMVRGSAARAASRNRMWTSAATRASGTSHKITVRVRTASVGSYSTTFKSTPTYAPSSVPRD